MTARLRLYCGTSRAFACGRRRSDSRHPFSLHSVPRAHFTPCALLYNRPPMCLLVLAWKHHPRYRLILAGNRDEFHERPAAPLGWWQDEPRILGGRDLKANGTWLGVGRSGGFGVVA